MPKVKFSEDFDFSPKEKNGHVTVAYKKGMVAAVPQECASVAIKLGRAKAVKNGSNEEA